MKISTRILVQYLRGNEISHTMVNAVNVEYLYTYADSKDTAPQSYTIWMISKLLVVLVCFVWFILAFRSDAKVPWSTPCCYAASPDSSVRTKPSTYGRYQEKTISYVKLGWARRIKNKTFEPGPRGFMVRIDWLHHKLLRVQAESYFLKSSKWGSVNWMCLYIQVCL
jgi:hypothetical protein